LKKYILGLATVCLGLSLTAAAAVSVTVTSPSNGAQLSSPFNLVAHATGSYTITGWVVYLDGKSVYSAGQTDSINTSISAAQGGHQLVTRAWDASGAYGSVSEQITITGGGGGGGGGGGLPSPPPGALVFNNIDDGSGWQSCHDPGCAGGSGEGAYWMAQNQNPPSRDGASAEFFNSGVWANALWWRHLGAHDNVRNFLWDFYFYVDGNSPSATQALEFDAFQFVSGYNYMIGTECDYGSGLWDTWDEGAGHWYHTSVGCPKFSPNTWHHVQMYLTTNISSHQYTYVTLVVDGNVHPINITRNAKYLGWSDNLGVQWQLDVNASGQGYHEWVDQATLTVW
jgi:Big-like domain-containing protein